VLSPAERLRAVEGALAMRRVDRDDPATDEESFGAWLRAHRQPTRVVEALWELVGIATLNARADDASLAVAATVFQIGLLEQPDAADIGWSIVPLQRLHGDAAVSALSNVAADVRVQSRVRALDRRGARWALRTDDEELLADAVVVATEPHTAEQLLPEGALANPRGWSERLGTSPIVNVHLVFDRQVMADEFVAGVDTPVQWIFDRTRQSGLGSGQYLALSLSAADDLVKRPVAELRELFVPEVRRMLPAAAAAQLVDFFVTREPDATFRAGRGTRRFRPGVRTQLPGLFVAGAYTDTGWPATMESAVRSGETAAGAVLASRFAEQAVTA